MDVHLNSKWRTSDLTSEFYIILNVFEMTTMFLAAFSLCFFLTEFFIRVSVQSAIVKCSTVWSHTI